MQDNNFKKWTIYEAATGTYKFSGLLNNVKAISSSPSAAAIANTLLVFDNKGIKEYLPITPEWAGKYTGHVDFNVRVKSSGSSALVINTTKPKIESMGDFQNHLDMIISEEYDNIHGQLLLEWQLMNVIKNSAGFIKKQIVNITQLLEKVWDRIIKVITSWAKEGYSYMMNQLGFYVDGSAKINVSF